MVSGPASPNQRVCTVSLRGSPGGAYYSHTTMATTLFGAVARAIEFFESAFWKGPRPVPDTVFRVQLVSSERRFFVRAADVRRARSSGGLERPPGVDSTA